MAALLLAVLKFYALRRYIPRLNLPPRLLAFGALAWTRTGGGTWQPFALGVASLPPRWVSAPPSLAPILFKLDLSAAFGWGFFGVLLRNMHRWSAHGMVAVVFLHLCRVFFTGAYKPPREFNWVVGVLLLVLTLLLSFTGYLLPWDQIAYWAITIGGNMAGYAPLFNTPGKLLLLAGLEVSGNTLLRFYVLHIMVFPLVAAIFLAVHFWRIRKDGGISGPL